MKFTYFNKRFEQKKEQYNNLIDDELISTKDESYTGEMIYINPLLDTFFVLNDNSYTTLDDYPLSFPINDDFITLNEYLENASYVGKPAYQKKRNRYTPNETYYKNKVDYSFILLYISEQGIIGYNTNENQVRYLGLKWLPIETWHEYGSSTSYLSDKNNLLTKIKTEHPEIDKTFQKTIKR